MTLLPDADLFALDEAMRLLEATPATLRALLEGLPEGWLHFQEDPDAWSPHTVLIHLVHNERTNWIPRVRVVLSPDAIRKFPPFHQLPEDGQQGDEHVSQLMDEFARLRHDSLSIMRGLSLTPDQFDREAEHPSLGTVNLKHLLATWVVHDLNHLHQITKSLAKAYRGSVGPWRRYLAILDL